MPIFKNLSFGLVGNFWGIFSTSWKKGQDYPDGNFSIFPLSGQDYIATVCEAFSQMLLEFLGKPFNNDGNFIYPAVEIEIKIFQTNNVFQLVRTGKVLKRNSSAMIMENTCFRQILSEVKFPGEINPKSIFVLCTELLQNICGNPAEINSLSFQN